VVNVTLTIEAPRFQPELDGGVSPSLVVGGKKLLAHEKEMLRRGMCSMVVDWTNGQLRLPLKNRRVARRPYRASVPD
jgi:hypothetical protein